MAGQTERLTRFNICLKSEIHAVVVGVVVCCTVDTVTLSEPGSPGGSWFLEQFVSLSGLTLMLFGLTNSPKFVS